MARSFQRFAVILGAVLSLAGCSAHLPQFAILKSMVASVQLASYTAALTGPRDTTHISYAKPDRCRRTNAEGTTIVVGRTAYRESRDDPTWIPMPAGSGATLLCAEQPFVFLAAAVVGDFDDLGTATLDGKPVHKWQARHTVTQLPSKPILWIGDDDRIARVDGVSDEFGTGTLRYSDFDAPTAIEAPPLTPAMREYAKAIDAAVALKSVHAAVTSRGRTTTIDYAAPDDYAKTQPPLARGLGAPRTIHVDRKTYFRGSGFGQRNPPAWTVTNDRRGTNFAFLALAPRRFFPSGESVRVHDLGSAALDGLPMHRYRVEPAVPPKARRRFEWPATLWIDAAHHLVRVDAFVYGYGDAVVRYSEFDSAPAVTAPT